MLAAVSRETPENARKCQSQNTLDPEMAQEYISQVSGETERRVTKKLSKDFSQRESLISRAFSKLDYFFLNPQFRTCSVAVPGTFSSSDSENREPTGDRSLKDPCPEALFSTYHSENPNDLGQEAERDASHGDRSSRRDSLSFPMPTGVQEEIPNCSPGTLSGN